MSRISMLLVALMGMTTTQAASRICFYLGDTHGLFPFHVGEMYYQENSWKPDTWRIVAKDGISIRVSGKFEYTKLVTEPDTGHPIDTLAKGILQEAYDRVWEYYTYRIDPSSDKTAVGYSFASDTFPYSFVAISDPVNLGTVSLVNLGTPEAPVYGFINGYEPGALDNCDAIYKRANADREGISLTPYATTEITFDANQTAGVTHSWSVNNTHYYTKGLNKIVYRGYEVGNVTEGEVVFEEDYVSVQGFTVDDKNQYLYAIVKGVRGVDSKRVDLVQYDLQQKTSRVLWQESNELIYAALYWQTPSVLLTKTASDVYRFDMDDKTMVRVFTSTVEGDNDIILDMIAHDEYVYMARYTGIKRYGFANDELRYVDTYFSRRTTGERMEVVSLAFDADDTPFVLTNIKNRGALLKLDPDTREILDYIYVSAGRVAKVHRAEFTVRGQQMQALDVRTYSDIVRFLHSDYTDLADLLAPNSLPEGYAVKKIAANVKYPRAMIVNRYNDVFLTENGNVTLYVTQGYEQDDFVLKDKYSDSINMFNGKGCTHGITAVCSVEDISLNHGIAHNHGHVFASSSQNVFAWEYSDATLELARTPFGEIKPVVKNIESETLLEGDNRNRGHKTRELLFDAIGNLFIQISSEGDVDLTSDRSVIKMVPYPILLDVLANGTAIDWATLPTYATGLRNMVGMTLDPKGEVWGVNMGADDLQLEYTPVEDHGFGIKENNPQDTLYRLDSFNADRFYGYPQCFLTGEDLLDENGVVVPEKTLLAWVGPNVAADPYTNEECQNYTKVVPPVMGLGAHIAPIQIVFNTPRESAPDHLSYDGKCHPDLHKRKMFDENFAVVSNKGSWVSQELKGYRLSSIPFELKQWTTSEGGVCDEIQKEACSASTTSSDFEEASVTYTESGCCDKEPVWLPVEVEEERSMGTLIANFKGKGVVKSFFENPTWKKEAGISRIRPTGLTFGVNGELFGAHGTAGFGELFVIYKK